MINAEKINDRLLTIEAMAYRILDEVATVRKELSITNTPLSRIAQQRKLKTDIVMLRRKKHLLKKLNRGQANI